MTVLSREGSRGGNNNHVANNHVAGAGHAAAGMVRRSTAPGPPPMYLESCFTPPPSSAAERRGSFNGRRSVDCITPQSRGNPHANEGQTLEDENRSLREELSRLQTTAIESLNRRPMAAIAGGGFRGPTNNQPKQCMCDSLRSKLVKIKQELREARDEQRFPSRSLFPMETHDAAAQTSPNPQVPPSYQPPQTAPSSFKGAARLLASAVCQSSKTDAPTQTDGRFTAEAASQVVLSISDAEAQTATFERTELGVQAGSGISLPADVQTQTAPPPVLANTASQVVADACEAAVQAMPTPSDASAQTDALPAPTAAAEAEVQTVTVQAVAATMQTDPPPASRDAACLADIPSPSKQAALKLCSAACQTTAPARSSASTQTQKASKTAVAATQAAPPRGVDQATQAEDERLEELLERDAKRETRLRELEARLLQLSNENDALKADCLKYKEQSEAFQHMAQTKAFGQMNVTILCPRAECTVSGERVEMDSWNPARLREEFEREVLPRFTRVFVEESVAGMPKGSKARSEAVDKAMQDFAETFRERLSAMLSAPNAAAAVQAAASAKSKK